MHIYVNLRQSQSVNTVFIFKDKNYVTSTFDSSKMVGGWKLILYRQKIYENYKDIYENIKKPRFVEDSYDSELVYYKLSFSEVFENLIVEKHMNQEKLIHHYKKLYFNL
jgi:hypothetical protein